MDVPVSLFSFERNSLKRGRQTRIIRPFAAMEQTFVLGSRLFFFTEDGVGPRVNAIVSGLDVVDYRSFTTELAVECGFTDSAQKPAVDKVKDWYTSAYPGLVSAMVVVYKLERE